MPQAIPAVRPGITVSWRQPGTLFIDLPDGRTLRCEPVAHEVARVTALMDGRRTADDLAASSGVDPQTVRWIAQVLDDAGAFVADREQSVIEIQGCGELGTAVADLLLACETGSVLLAEPIGHVDSAGFSDSRPRSLRASLLRQGHLTGQVRVKSDTGCSPTPDLVVFTAQTDEPDRAASDALTRDGIPYLLTSFVGSSLTVGPLVRPGITSCLRCADLQAAYKDPNWLRRLAARSVRPAVLDRAALSWTASTVVQQVRGWFTHKEPDSLGTALELDTTDWLLRSRRWPVHPDCGCQ